MFILPQLFFNSGGYAARGVALSSSNYLTAATSLLADSKLITMVVWLKSNMGNGGRYFYINNSTYGNIFQFDAGDNGLRIEGNGPLGGGQRYWEIQSDDISGDGDVWKGFLCSVDLATVGSSRQYNKDTDIENLLNTFSNNTMNLSGDGGGSGTPFYGIGYTGSFGTSGFDVADIWVKSGVAIDFDVEANRRLFIDSAGKPVDLGDTGVVDGNTPEIYLSLRQGDAVSSYATNKGSAGNFSITGTLTESSTSPSD